LSGLAAVESVVQREMERVGVPGVAVGTLHDGRVETGAWGVANLATGEPLRPDAAFRIASITKPFTATLTLALHLDLDDAALTGEDFTLRHLLSHSSGLDCELPALERHRSFDELDFSVVRRWATPGELWAYSNAGYWLAGAIVERVAGTSFEEAMRTHVLEPLGLERTTFDVEDAVLGPVAVGHAGGEVVRSCYRFPRVRRPSGGLISTVEDLLTFAGAQFEGRYAALREPVVEGIGCHWGLGWALHRGLAFHPGGYGGFATLLLLAHDQRFAVAVLTNDLRGKEVTRPVADAALEAVLGIQRPRPKPIEVPAEELAKLAGVYRQEELEVRVTAEERGLVLEVRAFDVSRGVWDEQPPLRAAPLRDLVFRFEGSDELFDFPREGLGRFGGRLTERA
jgi:CubicO group peptidase (beta-lactamase class C family)